MTANKLDGKTYKQPLYTIRHTIERYPNFILKVGNDTVASFQYEFLARLAFDNFMANILNHTWQWKEAKGSIVTLIKYPNCNRHEALLLSDTIN